MKKDISKVKQEWYSVDGVQTEGTWFVGTSSAMHRGSAKQNSRQSSARYGDEVHWFPITEGALIIRGRFRPKFDSWSISAAQLCNPTIRCKDNKYANNTGVRTENQLN